MTESVVYGGLSSTRVRVHHLQQAKERGEKWAMLTAYDTVSASVFEEAGIPVLLVGDSSGNVVLGYSSTVPVTVEDILLMTKAVTRSTTRTLVVADMPFGSYESGPDQALATAFRLMKEQSPQGGRIINNGSISAYTPRPNSAAYTATKHAVSGLTKSLALDGRKYDIACGQIDIGNAATEMTERMTQGAMQADGRMMPEPRADVRLVADAVVYMASLPLEANVLFMNVMATKMPFVGRG